MTYLLMMSLLFTSNKVRQRHSKFPFFASQRISWIVCPLWSIEKNFLLIYMAKFASLLPPGPWSLTYIQPELAYNFSLRAPPEDQLTIREDICWSTVSLHSCHTLAHTQHNQFFLTLSLAFIKEISFLSDLLETCSFHGLSVLAITIGPTAFISITLLNKVSPYLSQICFLFDSARDE